MKFYNEQDLKIKNADGKKRQKMITASLFLNTMSRRKILDSD